LFEAGRLSDAVEQLLKDTQALEAEKAEKAAKR
jgi:hypothetical protein